MNNYIIEKPRQSKYYDDTDHYSIENLSYNIESDMIESDIEKQLSETGYGYVTFCGDWNNNGTYSYSCKEFFPNVCKFEKTYYLCIKSNTHKHPTDKEYWKAIAYDKSKQEEVEIKVEPDTSYCIIS